MLKRILTGLIMAVVLIPLLIVGKIPFLILASALAYVAGSELLGMYAKADPALKYVKYIAPIWSVVTILCAYFEPSLLIITIASGILMFLILPITNQNYTFATIKRLIFSYLYTGCLLLLVIMPRFINNNMSSNSFFTSGFYLMTYAIIAIMSGDIGAYFIGSLIGKHKLCPTISPKKTVEGAIGGLVTSIILGTCSYFLGSYLYQAPLFNSISGFKIGWQIIIIVVISALLAIFGQLGDLVASKMKREYGIKDYGYIFPGHGGVLDRFDSLILAGAFFYIICVFFGEILLI